MRVQALLFCLCAVAGLGSCGADVFAQNSKAQSAAAKPRVPAATLELIRYQAARAKEHAAEAGTAASRAERAKADMQGQAEKDRVERMNQGGGVRPDTPPVSPAELAGMRERAAQYAEYMKRVGEAKAAQKEREAEEKSEELQRQADDLERQLTDEGYNKHRDIKLNPVGTNLYIRNYSQIPPTIVPLRAHAANLSGAASSATTSAKVGQTSGAVSNLKVSGQGKNSILRKTDVRGKVLPK